MAREAAAAEAAATSAPAPVQTMPLTTATGQPTMAALAAAAAKREAPPPPPEAAAPPSDTTWGPSTQELDLTTQMPVTEVHVDALAAMKIAKHCDDNLPTMVAGSLLGLDVDGVLEVTYSYPFPSPKVPDGEERGRDEPQQTAPQNDVDGQEYQMEMMKMLREVNVDNNCVGWYQSMYLGTMYTNDVVNYQFSYQSHEELSENSVVIMYDPIQSSKGNTVLRAFRLSPEFVKMRLNKENNFISPDGILEELPVKIKTAGHVSGFASCLSVSHKSQLDCSFAPLGMTAGDTYTERNLEMMASWIDDFVSDQQRFNQYARLNAKARQDQIRWLSSKQRDNAERRKEGEGAQKFSLADSGIKNPTDAPPKLDPLLMLSQMRKYCDQINTHAETTFMKLFVSESFHKE
jgi:translation initiation factor 3 subunit H